MISSNSQKIFFAVAVLLGILQAGQLVFSEKEIRGVVLDGEALGIESGELGKVGVAGGILPHNSAVRGQIEAYLNRFEDDYDTVVLLAPNHLGFGPSNVQVAGADFSLNKNSVSIDNDLNQKFLATGLVEQGDDALQNELSIKFLLPLLQNKFPKSEFELAIFKTSAKDQVGEALARILADEAKAKKILVLGTVDFSHYQPMLVADFHDTASQLAVETFDYDRINNLEIDSPVVLKAALKTFEKSGLQKAGLFKHSNTGEVSDDKDMQTTSHFFCTFHQGASRQEKNLSLLFFGDMMLDRGVKQIIQARGVGRLFERLKGEENRFFMGVDYVGANLEGAVTVSGNHLPPAYVNDFAFDPADVGMLKQYDFNIFNLANNHLADQAKFGETQTRELLGKAGFDYFGCRDSVISDCSIEYTKKGSTTIAWLGFSSVYRRLDQQQLKDAVANARKQADFVIVSIHWGREYKQQASEDQKNVAHLLIDSGADVVLGTHPHVVEGIEKYNKGLVFYSLGNFIFDQYFSKATQEGLGVGLSLSEKNLEAFIFPLDLRKSQPKLMSGNQKNAFLGSLADLSDPSLKEEIKNGRIRISK